MNMELEMIDKFRDNVMEKKSAGWSDEAFWNLVAFVHLEKSGFATERCPTPVNRYAIAQNRGPMIGLTPCWRLDSVLTPPPLPAAAEWRRWWRRRRARSPAAAARSPAAAEQWRRRRPRLR
jgi:hypothetical protein